MRGLVCARCRQSDDGKRSCLVECATCCGAGCERCQSAGEYMTYHMVLADDPAFGAVELKPMEEEQGGDQ